MSNSVYAFGLQSFGDADIDWSVDTIKIALVTNGYTPNLSTHQYLSDIGANTVGTDQTLGSKSNTGGVLDGADVTFTAVAGGSTVNYVLVYKSTGVAGTSILIALFDTATGLPVTTNGGDITVTWDNGANRILKI